MSIAPVISVERSAQGQASLRGLAQCGSVWACPCCSNKITAERANELRQAVESWHQQGGTVALLTLTMRHRRGVPLATYWDALTPALAASIGGRYTRARNAKINAGYAGHVVSREATFGEHSAGWHLHIHALLFLNDPQPAALEELGAALFAAWSSRLVREGLDAPSLRHGIDLKVLNLEAAREHAANYLAKGTYESSKAASELTGAAAKSARRGNRTPWDVLADLSRYGRPQDRAIWREWEQTSRGRRALTWSVGLRDRLELGEELTDDELTAEDEPLADPVLLMPSALWRQVRARPHGPTDLLDAVETANSAPEARHACLTLLRRWKLLRAGPAPPGRAFAA